MRGNRLQAMLIRGKQILLILVLGTSHKLFGFAVVRQAVNRLRSNTISYGRLRKQLDGFEMSSLM